MLIVIINYDYWDLYFWFVKLQHLQIVLKNIEY